MAEELKAFQREDRYIVIKRKDLAALADKGELRPASLDGLMDLCADLPAREYVVIESDWPEYPIVWQMIKARMNGRAQLPSQGCDAVEVVAVAHVRRFASTTFDWEDGKGSAHLPPGDHPLMTVAQHNRIVADVRANRDAVLKVMRARELLPKREAATPSPGAELVELLREASSWIDSNSFHGTDAVDLMRRIDAKLAELQK